jgi:hypothetical protein
MTYRVLLHGGRGEAHARVPQALVACMREHLRAAGLLHVVDFFNAALLALRCRAEGFEVLLVGEDVGKVRCGLLQRASGPYGFGRLFVCGMGRGRVDGVLCQVAQSASRGCLGQALLGCYVRHVVLLLLLLLLLMLRPGVSSTRRGQDRWIMRAQAAVQGAGRMCKNAAFSESATKARDSARQAEGCSSNVVVVPSRWRLGKSHPGRPDHSRLVAGFPGSLPPPESGHASRHHRSSLRRRVKSRRELDKLKTWPHHCRATARRLDFRVFRITSRRDSWAGTTCKACAAVHPSPPLSKDPLLDHARRCHSDARANPALRHRRLASRSIAFGRAFFPRST